MIAYEKGTGNTVLVAEYSNQHEREAVSRFEDPQHGQVYTILSIKGVFSIALEVWNPHTEDFDGEPVDVSIGAFCTTHGIRQLVS